MTESWNLNRLRKVVRAQGGMGQWKVIGWVNYRSRSQSNQKTLDLWYRESELKDYSGYHISFPPSTCLLNSTILFTS